MARFPTRSSLVSLISLLSALTSPVSGYVSGTAHTAVQTLTVNSFRQAVADPANGLWLLEFYAPWCGHCKRLAPILEEIAPIVAGKMAIGIIDCTVEKEICQSFNVKGFPTLKIARDGDIFDYPGSRARDDLIKFARKMGSPAVTLCPTFQDALDIASSSDGIVFVAYHPDVQGEKTLDMLQSTHLTQIFAQVARKDQAFAHFCLLSTTADLTPLGIQDAPPHGLIAKLELNAPPVLLQPVSDDGLTTSDLRAFVKEKNVPLLTALGPHNFHKIGRNGRPLVIGVVDGSVPEQVELIKQNLVNYATTGPKAIVDRYYFGWIDGKAWHKFLTQFDISPKELPQVFVLDVPAQTFWQGAEYKSATDILKAIEDGTVQPRESGKAAKGAFSQAQRFFFRHLPWSLAWLVGACALLIILIVPTPDKLRPPYPQDTEASTTPSTATSEVIEESPPTEGETETKKEK